MTTEELQKLAATYAAAEHAGTVDDPIPQQLLYTKTSEDGTKKVYTVAAGIAIGGSGTGGTANPATDTVMGIVKLTDDPETDAPAATGHTALTPNGAKVAIETAKSEITQGITDTVNGAIDDALADGGKLDGAIEDAIQDKIESGEIGGGGDGSSSLVLKPGIVAPLEGASNVSVMVQLQASAYKCLLENEQRKHREFVISTVSEPVSEVFKKELNVDSASVDTQLSPQTQYKWRCRDVSANGLRSAWTDWQTFTTGNAISVDTPTVTCSEGTTDVPETPTFTLSAFNITPDQGDTASQHQSTTWRLLSVDDSNSQVWASENDTTNKTSITLARGILQANKTYLMQATYNSVTYGSSSAGAVQFTTNAVFTHVATPTITIDGGTVNVGETPVFRGSAFTIEPSGSDTHVSSTWVVTKKSDSSEIYRLDQNSVQKTTMTLPGSLLATSQTYTVSLVYHSQNYGDSAAGTLEFTCADTFKGIKTPTLSLQGASDDGLVDYAASYVASQFEFIGGEDTCDKVDWELYKGDDKVWSAANSTILRYLGSFSGYTLEPSTAYVLKYRQHAKTNDVWSAWAELAFTTVSEFNNPTIHFKFIMGGEGGHETFNLSKMLLWYDTSLFHVYKNGSLDASLTSNIDQDIDIGSKVYYDEIWEGPTEIEIKRIDGQNKYPYICFNGVSEFWGGAWVHPETDYGWELTILAPLPTLYDSKDAQEPSKYFAGGFVKGVIGGPFYKCNTLGEIPADVFKFNPQVVSFGGMGSGGGGGGGGRDGAAGGTGGGAAGGTGGGGGSDGGAGGDGYGCFTDCSGLVSLPELLFAYCPNAVNFGGIGGGGGGGGSSSDGGAGGAGGDGYGCFTDCSGLVSLPELLFAYCPNAVNFGGIGGGGGGGGGGTGDGAAGAGGDGYGCFTGCYGLTSLPESLFAYCPNAVNLLNAGAGGGGGGADGYGSGGRDGGTGGGAAGGGGGYGIRDNAVGSDGTTSTDMTTTNKIPTSGKGIFAGCTNLTTVPQDLLRNFGTTNDVVGANLIGTFEGCSQLSATLYFDAENIAQGCVKNFAKDNKAAATVFAKSSSTTYNSFHDESTANVNVIPF